MKRPPAFMFCSLLALCPAACGGRSSLDDYADGVPDIIPSPIVDVGDASAGEDAGMDQDGGREDGGGHGGREDGGGRDGGGEEDGGSDAGPERPEGNAGAACEDDSDCMGLLGCAEEIDLFVFPVELPGGYCSGSCESDEDCPRGSGCEVLLGACMQECTRDTQCRANEGYACTLFTPFSARPFCVPASE